MIDVLVKGGRVVSGGSVQEADLAIQDGKIAGVVHQGLIREAKQTIDAAGKLVLPGVVDSHFHCRNRTPVPLVDDMLTGTRSGGLRGRHHRHSLRVGAAWIAFRSSHWDLQGRGRKQRGDRLRYSLRP